MRKLFTQLFSVLMLICVFGFQASTFAADPVWDGEKSIPMDEDMNVDPADIATQFVVAYEDVPAITAAGGTMAVYKEDGDQLLKVIPINNSSSDVQVVGNTLVVDHGMATIMDETDYYIVITEGAVIVGDDNDEGAIGPNSWSFTVGDFTPPKLVSDDPLVPVGDGVEATMFGDPFELTLEFDEDVAFGEGTIAIYLENGTVVELIDVEDLDPMYISGTMVTVPVNDDARFVEETNYYVRVAPGAIVDVVDAYGPDAEANAYAGITDNTSWTFSTRINSAPAITASVSDVMGDEAKLNVELDADGAFYYLVQLESAGAPADMTNFTKVDDVEAGVAESVTIDAQWDATPLMGETKYEVYIVSENDEDPINQSGLTSKKLVFTTLDNTAPVGYYDGDDVIVNADGKTTGAMMYFNEEVIGGEGLLSVRKIENNALATEIPATGITSTKVVDGDDDDSWEDWWRVEFDFGVELESATEYYIVFHNGFITDLAGNEYADPVDEGDAVPDDKGEWVLQSSDFEAPMVTFWTDTKTTETTTDIVDAGNDDYIYVQFDEEVMPVNGDNWDWLDNKEWTQYVTLKLDGIIVEADFDYNDSEDRIEIEADSDLESNTTYTVIVRPGLIEDESGNVIADEQSITVTVGDNEDAEYEFAPTTDLKATDALVIEFTKDVFVADTDGDIDHALTTDDLEDILVLEVDDEDGDLEEVDTYTAVYDPATMKITVTFDDVWPTSICGIYDAEVRLSIDNSDLVDSKEDAFSGADEYLWNVKDYEAPEVTLLSGDVEMTDMTTDNATIQFTEPVSVINDPSHPTFLSAVTLKMGSADGENLPFTISNIADGITLVPDGWTWTKDKTYYYGMGELFEDCAGNAAPATFGTFTVVGDPVPPMVEALTYTVNGGSAIDIDDEAEGVVVNSDDDVVIEVTFNMNVNDKDLTQLVATTFPGVPTVTITTDDISGSVLTITIADPVMDLPATEYTVTIPQDLLESNEVIDGSKVGLDGDVIITVESADLEKPTIDDQDPVAGTVDVALDLDEGEMTIYFSEEVVLGSGAITFSEDGDVEQTVTISAANVVVDADDMTAVVSLDPLMLYSTVYTVDIPAEAFEDVAGNELDMDYSWTYTTMDNPPPMVAEDGLSPADGSDLVALSGDLQMTFTEDVVANTAGSRKAIYIYELDPDGSTRAMLDPVTYDPIDGDDILHDFTYADMEDVKVDGNLVTITGLKDLEESKEYFVLIVPGAFVDLSEPTTAEYAGIETYDAAVGAGWDFSTGDVVNAAAELDFTKLGLDELVATDSDIKIVFTKPIVKVDGDDITDEEVATLFMLEKNVEGTWVEINFTGTISDDKKTITIDNSSLVILEELKGSTEYRVSFAGNVIESEGNETPLAAWEDTFWTSDYEAPDAPVVDFATAEVDAIWYGENSDEVMAHIAELTLTDDADDAVALYYYWTTDLDTDFTAQSVKDVGVMVKVGSDSGDDIPSGGTEDLLFEEGMENETEYRVVAIAVDAAGNMSEVEDFTYITDDVVAPELTGDLPTEFSETNTLEIMFDEDVMAVPGAYARVIDADGVVYMATMENLAGDDEDANIITIVIDADLVPLANDVATYTIEIDGGMVVDVPRKTEDDDDANDPNEYAGLFGSTFVVTTADQVSPELVSITPGNDDDDPVEVGTNPTFTLEFDEAVELNSDFISFTIYEGDCDDLDFGETAVMKSASADGDPYDVLTVENISGEGTDMITVTTNRAMEAGKEYVLVVEGGTFDDMSGNTWEEEGECVNLMVADTEPLTAIFRMPVYNDDPDIETERPFYLPYDGEVPAVPDGQMVITFGSFEDPNKVYSGFDPDDDDGDVIDHDEYFLSPDEPNLDLFELKEHVYFKVDGVDMPFEIEVSSSYNHKIWIIVDEDDLEDYRGQTITYGFVNLYDEAGNLNEGEEVSFVIAEDAVVMEDVIFEPGDNDDDSETLVTITPDQVFTITFNGIIFSYDCCDEDDNNLIMTLELLEDLETIELYDEDNDDYVEVELLSYSEESGKSVVTLAAAEDLDSETEYTLYVDDNVQIGQGHDPIDNYEEHYVTSDVDAPMLIADGDGDTLEEAYLPVKDGVVGKTKTLELVFDEKVVGAGMVEIRRWDGQLIATVDVTGNTSNDDDTDDEWVIEIADIADVMAANPEFITNESYYVVVPDTSIVDMAVMPNAFAGISTVNEWRFDLRDDTTPVPTFVQNEEMGVAVNTTIDITFDREVETSYGWLAIYEEMDGDAVELLRIEDDIDFSAGTSFSFDIDELAPSTKYYVELGEGSFVLSADGDTKQEQVEIGTWWFSTEDNSAPVPVMFSPANEEELTYSALPGQDLVIKFDKPVVPGTGNIQLHNMLVTGDDIIDVYDVTDATRVVFTDSTVTIPGDQLNLLTNGAYYVIIPGTAISNTSSSPEFWEGITTPLEWKFGTGVTPVYPELQSWTPQDTIEGTHPDFVMTFVDTVMLGTAGTLTVTAMDSTEASLVIDITASMIDGNVVTVSYDTMMTNGLNINTTYIVNVDAGVLVDAGSGLGWDGVSNDTDWTFTTGMDFTTDVELPISAELDFKVYPNPFNNFIRVDNYDKLTRVVITNIAGQRVLDIEYPSYEIQTGSLVTGVYVVTLIADDTIVKSDRIIKR